MRQRSQALPQFCVVRSAAPIPHRHPHAPDNGARPPLAHVERRTQVSDSLSLGSGRHHFFPRADPSARHCRAWQIRPLDYFPAQNWGLRHCDQLILITQTPPDERRGPTEGGGGRDELKSRLLFHDPADVDDVVGDDAETHPAVHSDGTLVSAAVEAVSPFDDADASLASGAPFLAVAEPALSLLALAFRAFGRAIGNANALDPLRLCGGFILGGIECGVRRYQTRRASQQGLMGLDGRDQQVRIIGPLRVDLVIGDDLVLRLLQFHHLAELVGLAGLALANDFGRWLEQAEELALTARVAAEDTCPGLLHHLPDARRHQVKFLPQALQCQLFQNAPRPLHALGYLAEKRFACPTT